MNRVLPLYVVLQVTLQGFVADRVENIKERRDRGVTGMEYAALIIVAAAVIGILFTAVNGTVRGEVTKALKSLFNPSSN